MSTSEYIVGLALAVGTAILVSVLSRRSSFGVFRMAQGVSVGFSAFLIGLLVSTAGGNVYVNILLAAGLLSLITRHVWRSR